VMRIDPGRPPVPDNCLAASAMIRPEPGKPTSTSTQDSSERTKETLVPRIDSQCTPRAISTLRGHVVAAPPLPLQARVGRPVVCTVMVTAAWQASG